MPPVLPAGLRPEGRAGAEYHVEISLNRSQFGETEVRAKKAADSHTVPLPTGSTARASSASSSEKRGALAAHPGEGLGMRNGLSSCRGVQSWGCPGEVVNAVSSTAGLGVTGSLGTADVPAGQPSRWPSDAQRLVGFGRLSPRSREK